VSATKVFAVLLCAVSLAWSPFSVTARAAAQDVVENPDVESPEAIAEARARIAREFAGSENRVFSAAETFKILDKYKYLDPKHEVPSDLLQQVVVYFDANKDKFPNQNYITVVDFSRHSAEYRIFMISMATGKVEKFHTTHGVGSDTNDDGYAESFGNVINSGKSSIGFARTTDTYSGTYGVAVRLDGLSSTNSNMRARAVVYHGWDKVKEANVKQGLSHGCFTLDYAVKPAVIDKVKGGSLFFAGVSKVKRKSVQ
jgi:hypothetical protein